VAKRLIALVAILIVLGGAGLFILDRTLFAPVEINTALPVAPTLAVPTPAAAQPASTAPTDAPAATPAGSETSASGDTKLYRIDASQSEVRYEIGETLFNQNNRFNVAIGRTRGIAGDVLVNFAQPSNSRIGEIVIDVSQFTSDESRRDNYIRRNGLQSSRYPTARFVPAALEGLPDQAAVGDQVTFTIGGDLIIKDIARPVRWKISLRLEDGRLVGSASTEILLSDFDAGPLQLPMLATEDLAKLFFDFVALPVEG